MKVEAALIFVAPNADRNIDRCDIQTEVINLHVVGVSNYSEGVLAAKELVANGVKAMNYAAVLVTRELPRLQRP